MRSIYVRIALYLLIVAAILNGWWLAAFVCLSLGSWLFSFSFEWIIAGAAHDSLFGMSPSLGISGYAGIILGVTAFLIVRISRSMLRS